MRTRALNRIAWLPLTALVLGCGDAGPDLGDLTEAEAASLLAALSTVWFPTPSAPAQAAQAPGLFPVPETTVTQDTTNTVVACAAGGTATVFSIDSISITVDSRLNPSPDTLLATNSVFGGSSTTTASYAGCSSPGSGGNTWTFDADPGLTFAYDIDGTLDSYTLTDQTTMISTTTNWTGLWSGSLDWSNGNRSGSCSISLTSTSTSSNVGGQFSNTFTQQGQVCGIDVSTSS